MSHYVVKFYKMVTAHGHQVDACQYVAEKYKTQAADALAAAKQDFCTAHHLRDWTVHADRVEVQEAEFPS
jgi:hypothetical protein